MEIIAKRTIMMMIIRKYHMYHSDEILRGIPPDISHLFEGVKNNVNVRNRMYV